MSLVGASIDSAIKIMNHKSKIYVAGHSGMVGSALLTVLRGAGFTNIVTKAHTELDLLDQQATAKFFTFERPEYVFLMAAKVGGLPPISEYPAAFLYENLQIQSNIMHQAYLNGVRKLLFVSSSCVYPERCPQPMKPEYILTGSLERGGEPYSVAKLAGIELCHNYNRQYGTNYITVIPATLYGPTPHFDLKYAHVLDALMRKFYAAKLANHSEVTLWGTGTPEREFLYVEDFAEACLFLMEHYDAKQEHYMIRELCINVGTGESLTISALASAVRDVVGFTGDIQWDITRPDGAKKKLLDSSAIYKLGWRQRTALKDGIRSTYEWLQAHSV